MKMLLMRSAGMIAACLLLADASAQSYPNKPVRIIVPTSPGGLTDLLARNLGQAVAESLGQPVVVENRAGGGSIIGMVALSKSPPDGYTVAITSKEPLVYNPLRYVKLPYDADTDFSYVSGLVSSLSVIVANASAPVSTFPEMIAYAKANPRKLNWATWGPGSSPAIYLEWINRRNGVEIVGIPYKGAGPSVTAIVSGQVHVTYTGIGLVAAHIQSGKLKGLAVPSAGLNSKFAGIPSLALFNSDPDLPSGYGAYAPAKTPTAMLDRLSAEFRKALATPQLNKIMAGSMEPVGSTPAEFEAYIRKAKSNAAMVFKTLGIQPTDQPE